MKKQKDEGVKGCRGEEVRKPLVCSQTARGNQLILTMTGFKQSFDLILRDANVLGAA